MFVEVQETDGDTVWVNTNTVTFIRDSPGEDYLAVHFKYGDLYVNRCEKKKILAALRSRNMLVDGR